MEQSTKILEVGKKLTKINANNNRVKCKPWQTIKLRCATDKDLEILLKKIGIEKNRKEVTILSPIMIPKFLKELLSVSISLIPTDNPIPKIGPIKGDISMAPITTAVELTFNPIEAITMEKIRIHAVWLLTTIPSFILSIVSGISVPSLISKSWVIKLLNASKNSLKEELSTFFSCSTF